MRHRRARPVQPPQELHAPLHIALAGRIRVSGTLIIHRDLISGLRVEMDHLFGDPQRPHGREGRRLLPAVDQKSGARPRDPADVRLAAHPKEEGLIGHAGLHAADIPYLRFRRPEYLRDQRQRLIVRTVPVSGVKTPQFFQIFKFADRTGRLEIGVKFRRAEIRRVSGALKTRLRRAVQHFLVDVFPIELLRSRHMIISLKDRKERFQELRGQIGRAVHDPGVAPAARHVLDPSFLI